MTQDFVRIYSRQEYLTPGAARTVDLIAETVRPDERTILLDVACGKLEAAAYLASHFGCRVVAVDLYDAFIHYAATKAWFFNLRDLITILRADGKRLPVRSAAVDAAYCIGAPSIVGLEPCLREMARAVRPGGRVVVSDAVWRAKPAGPLGPEWLWVAQMPQLSAADYAAAIEDAGLSVEHTEIHPRSDWEDYFRPMLQVAAEARAAADTAFAEGVESTVELERRAVAAFLDYATFIARKPSRCPSSAAPQAP